MWCVCKNQYSSGQATEELGENSRKLYKQMTGQPFTLPYIRGALRNHPKWVKIYGPGFVLLFLFSNKLLPPTHITLR
jgi:hypothetical protein